MALKVTLNCVKLVCVHYLNRPLHHLSSKKNLMSVYKNPFRIWSKFYCDDLMLGKDSAAPPKPKRKKTFEEPKILLKDEENKIILTTVEQATKIAKSKSMKLVKVKDKTENQKAVYELVSLLNMLKDEPESEVNTREQKKTVMISSKITDHDLEIKIKNIKKVLARKYVVQIVLSKEGNESNVQAILKKLETGVKGFGEFDRKVQLNNPKFKIKPVEAA